MNLVMRMPTSSRTLFVMLTMLGMVLATGCATFKRNEQQLAPASSLDTRALAKTQASLAARAGEAAEGEGNTEKAIRMYEQARTLDPEWDHLCRRLAVLYDQRGFDDRARTAYEQAVAIAPKDPDLLNDVGVFFLHREKWPTAESWFRRALEAKPDHARATNNLAMTLAMQGRLQESYEVFARVVGPASAYSNLGVLLARQGRTDEAREHFRRALALESSLRPAAEFLACIDAKANSQAKQPIQGEVLPASHIAK